MNCISTRNAGRVHSLPWTFLLLFPAIFVLAACGTSKFYDGQQSPAAGRTPADISPRQAAFTAAPPADTSDTLDFNGLSSSSRNIQSLIRQDGEVVRISFPGSPNLDATQQIRLDGKIVLTLVGDVQAARLTRGELEQSLIKLYGPQISTTEINVEVESSSFPGFVTGCVRPGKVLSDKPVTALEAIMDAGGFDYARAQLKKSASCAVKATPRAVTLLICGRCWTETSRMIFSSCPTTSCMCLGDSPCFESRVAGSRKKPRTGARV